MCHLDRKWLRRLEEECPGVYSGTDVSSEEAEDGKDRYSRWWKAKQRPYDD